MMRVRIAAAVALATGAILSMASPADAAAPVQSDQTIQFSIPVWTDCSQYPDAGNAIISAAGTIHRRVRVFTAADGSTTEVRHIQFTGVLTGPSGTTTYEGRFRLEFGPGGLIVQSGESKTFLPGRAAPLLTAGHSVAVATDTDVVTLKVTPKADQSIAETAVCQAIG